MNSGREKWPLVALAAGMLAGVLGLAAVGVGLVVGEPATTPPAKAAEQRADQSSGNVPKVQASTPPVAAQAVAAMEPASTPGQQAAPDTQPAASEQPVTPAPDAAAKPVATSTAETIVSTDYLRAHWDPIHFKPGIDKATDADCLKCHQEVLSRNVRDASPAGVKTSNTLAWYQTLDTYEGEQMTFHQRHLVAPFIKKVANMSCTTCHQGNNPRDEVPGTATDTPVGLTMRKMVDPNVCLMCHGQFPYKNMGLPGPWHESGAAFQNNCLLCHAAIRTTRHNVNFLNAGNIEKEGAANADSCYGCHGGRAWYRTSFPYPRHAWAGAGSVVPDWAKDRPTESDLRFLIQGSAPQSNTGSKP